MLPDNHLHQRPAILELNELAALLDTTMKNAMDTTDRVLESLGALHRYIRALATASAAYQVVDTVRSYLDAWPAERVAGVQTLDAGWAPFDDTQHPLPVADAGDVHRIHRALHNQCAGLRASGMEPTSELLELCLLFFFASHALEDLDTAAEPPRGRAAAARARLTQVRREPW